MPQSGVTKVQCRRAEQDLTRNTDQPKMSFTLSKKLEECSTGLF